MERENPPRITLKHLLGWTIVTAAALAILRPEFANGMQGNSSSDNFSFATAISRVMSATFFGMVCVSLATLVRCHLRGSQSFQHPGHWLLLINGSAWVLFMAIQTVLVQLADLIASQQAFYPIIISLIAVQIGLLIGYVFWRLKATIEMPWLLLWIVLTFSTLFGIFSTTTYLFANWAILGNDWHYRLGIGVVTGATLLFTVLSDRSLQKRDWMHYAGIAIVAFDVLTQLAWNLLIHVFKIL